MRWQLIAAVSTAIFVVLAGCSSSDTPADPADPADPVSTTNAGDGDGAGDEQATVSVPERSDDGLQWTSCGAAECTEIMVPADYSDPDGEQLSIAVGRLVAPGDRIGVLLVNPGGPGASGIDMLTDIAGGLLPPELEVFDIVSFDPRGVSRSEPTFACGSGGEQLALTNQIDESADTPTEVAAAESAVELCVQSMGEVAGLLHTEFVARDMDLVREALNEDQISYLGYSYGSDIGVWYASLFPDRVRAMVLDGARDPIDPIDTVDQRIANDIADVETFERLLTEAIAACDDDDCAMYNNGDPTSMYLEAAAKLDVVVAEVDDNPAAGFLGLITTLYSEDFWYLLYEGVAALVDNDDPSLFAELARFQLDDPSQPSFTGHVNCLDNWVVEAALDRTTRLSDEAALNSAIATELPLLNAMDISIFDLCPFYDLIAPPPLSIDLNGGDVPIMVIGNPNDPATPFVQSVDLANNTLSNGYLVEVEHRGHTVYPTNTCVNNLVHQLLVDLELPGEQRTVCARED